MKNQISIRISNYTQAQLNELITRMGDTQTGVITIAIEKLYREEIKMDGTDHERKLQAEINRISKMSAAEMLAELGITASYSTYLYINEDYKLDYTDLSTDMHAHPGDELYSIGFANVLTGR